MSPVSVNCCSSCGSPKLSPGTNAVNLRFVSWIVGAGMLVILIPVALGLAGIGAHALYAWFMNVVFERLLILALFSWMAGWILGERSRKTIGDLWLGLFRLIISGIATLARLLAKAFRK